MAEEEEGDGDKEGEEVDDLRPLGDAKRCPAQQFGRTVPMRVISLSVAAVVFVLGLLSVASAQRGVGDTQGVAQQPTKPKVVSLSGKVLEVKTESCQTTTGRSPLGTHLIMETSKGKKLNIHLGPVNAVGSVAKELSEGQKVKVKAFRTKKMKKGQYVARKLTFGSRTVELRDETLRPAWAGRGGPGWGRGYGRGAGWGRGAGYGRGRGQGWGRQGAQPGRYGACWWWSDDASTEN